ncbi:MAG: prepilin-type N-terminal cleavage/methylation domain-containing protein [Fimbriimonas sp.]
MKRRGFSLTEVLAVVAILALLAAIAFPIFAQARKRARLVECGERLHQVAQGLQMYRADNDEQLWQTYTGVGLNASTAGPIGPPWGPGSRGSLT